MGGGRDKEGVAERIVAQIGRPYIPSMNANTCAWGHACASGVDQAKASHGSGIEAGVSTGYPSLRYLAGGMPPSRVKALRNATSASEPRAAARYYISTVLL